MSTENSSGGSSYGQILKSSSIIGGAQAINYIIGLVRTKAVAVLIGPSGVGLVGLYVSIVGLASTVAQLGLGDSGVREVANAVGGGDQARVAAAATSLRRACWVTGVVGWILTAILSWPLTQLAFGSPEHVWAVAILGMVVLLEAVANGQKAILQGLRRIADIARLQIAAAVISTFLAVGIYSWLREDGIVPVIILTSLVQLGCSWFFTRRVAIQKVGQTWRETWRNCRQLLNLGAALMYGAVLGSVVGLAIRALIVRDLGLEAAGLYQAAWALSGLLGTFILQALATDFYPRLAAVAHDNAAVNRLMNEQIEVGMLLALPGVIGAIAFAPWLLHLLYSTEFTAAAELLPWLAIGVFGQVVTWPLGMVMQAKAATGWLYFNRTHNAIVQLICTVWLISIMGLLGAALGFIIYILWQGLLAFYIARRLTRFRVERAMRRVFWLGIALIAATLGLAMLLPQRWAVMVAGVFSGAVFLGACFELRKRLPDDSRINRLLKQTLSWSKRSSQR